MGWIHYHRPKGESHLDHFRMQMTGTCDPAGSVSSSGRRTRILDGAAYRGVFYGALEITEPSGRVFVTAAVIPFQWVPRSDTDFNFGYKAMTEDMGPVQSMCPQRILDLLSPVSDIPGAPPYASEWRARCRAHHADRAARPPIPGGSIVRISVPVTFTDDRTIDTFAVVARGRRREWWEAVRGPVYLDSPDGTSIHAGDVWRPGLTAYRMGGHIRDCSYEIVGRIGDDCPEDES